jgi:hypothetical protein
MTGFGLNTHGLEFFMKRREDRTVEGREETTEFPFSGINLPCSFSEGSPFSIRFYV